MTHVAPTKALSRGDPPVKASRKSALATLGLLSACFAIAQPASGVEGTSNPCDLPTGQLTTAAVPEGTDVEACNAIGRTVVEDGLFLEIPEPGVVSGTEEIYKEGAATFEITVTYDGEVSYASEGDADPDFEPTPREGSNPECGQSAYNTNDLKEYGRYRFYIGDGSFPAALSRSDFGEKVSNSVENIIRADNDCAMADNVSAEGAYEGFTTTESDMRTSGGVTSCGDGSLDNRDGTSTWDAGNIDKNGSPPVAKACWWGIPTPGAKNDLVEADVRFNISNYDFTVTPNSCRDKYDVVSVGTHEAGHVYGMGHVSESDYPWMTMSTNSEICDSSARTLGRGDIRGLESMY